MKDHEEGRATFKISVSGNLKQQMIIFGECILIK